MNDSVPRQIRIQIYSDPVCPWCYIGKRRLEKALQVDGAPVVEVSWQAFQLNPEMQPAGMDRQSYLNAKFGGESNASGVYAQVEAAGREEAIGFRFDRIQRTPNTLDSHRLIHYARHWPATQDLVVEALFERYFIDGDDIGDIEILIECAVRAGLEEAPVRQYLEGDVDQDAVREQDVTARQLGIQGVPFFIVEQRYAVSGAQPPEMFARVFETLRSEVPESASTPPPDPIASPAG